MIKIPRFDSGTSEEWIIFMNIVQMAIVGQNITTGPPMYKCIEWVLKGDAKAEFTQQANLVGSCTVGNPIEKWNSCGKICIPELLRDS